MNKVFRLTFIFAILMATCLAKGAELPSTNIQSTNITIIREYFSHYVRKVQQPFYLYHWRHAPDFVHSEDVQKNPQKYGHKIVEEDAPSFIPGLYVKERTSSSIYGGGLYAALDPVATEHYGGDSDSWAILVMHIPAGFQMIDLRTHDPVLTGGQYDQLKRAFANFNCPEFSNRSFIYGLMYSNYLSHSCADLFANVLSTLSVDGFLYSYQATDFKICQHETARHLAVIFSSSQWLMKAGADASVYTSKTTGDVEGRRIVESIFLYTYTRNSLGNSHMSILSPFTQRLLKEKFPSEYEKVVSTSTSYSCTSPSDCTTHCKLIYSGGSVSTTFRAEDYDQFLFSSLPAKFISSTNSENLYRSHWDDLISTETVKNLDLWIQENNFECGNTNFLANPPTGLQ